MIKALYPYLDHIIFVAVLLQLVFAVYLDLLQGKFPNKYSLAFCVFNLVLIFVLKSFSGLGVGFLTFGVAILLLSPIYYAKILGGGDIKLILAVSPLLLLPEFVSFLLMSFFWAGIFGLIKNLFGGSLRALLVNSIFTIKRVTVAEDKIPFTVGILLGWCSYKTFLSMGWM